MKRTTGICKYTLSILFFWLVQFHYLFAQSVEEPPGDHPLNPSPYKVVFYIIISFIVIAVVFKLLYRPGKN
ncbi:MAG: hypothetical protein WDZ72_05710 [Cyclobacteriaceae bacterium]